MQFGAGDTIAALSTPRGRSAIAVIRVTGPRVDAIGRQLVRPWPLADRVATLCDIHESADGSLIDRALATFFRAPASFTGEDVLEISTHGGNLVPALVQVALLNAGAREALPGEFTRRAVLNGRLDILQAEAIGDLIDASSHASHHAAIAQLDGSLSRAVLGLRDGLVELEALIGYDIDFPEEDDGPISRERISNAAATVIGGLEEMLKTAPVGELLREGALTVIAGPPNAGKSSLFNALLGQTRAIVTDVPGTTRDAIEAVIDVDSWPVRLVDTAGMRSTTDLVEKLGVEVSERYISAAHLILLCDDGSPRDPVALKIAAAGAAPVIRVRTKGDLVSQRDKIADTDVIVSSATREGLDQLLRLIAQTLEQRYGAPVTDAPLITRARHRDAFTRALAEIRQFETEWQRGSLPAPIAAVHLHEAVRLLEELIGTVEVDDVLDRLFSSFCVGK